MEFLIWHALAMFATIGISFLAGYLTAKRSKNNYPNINGL